MSLTTNGQDLTDLADSLRSELSDTYQALPGFRGMLALENPHTHQVLTITLWDNETHLRETRMLADTVVDRIARFTEVVATHAVYDVIGTLKPKI